MYANFGSQVTVVQDGTEFLPREDRDIAQAVKKTWRTAASCWNWERT